MTKKNKRWQRHTQNLREVRFSDLDTILKVAMRDDKARKEAVIMFIAILKPIH